MSRQHELSNLEKEVLKASKFVKDEFGLEINTSKLKQYTPEQWNLFCDVNGFNKRAQGLYLPQSYTAYTLTESPFNISDVFHEYFGHGLFCEHSAIGQELVGIEKNRGDSNRYLYHNVESKKFGLMKQNMGDYEGFATWMEALLCQETGNENVWDRKKEALPKERIELFEYFKFCEEHMTRYGFMAQMGFPKQYDQNKIIGAVKKLYEEKFSDIECIISYGSKKPYSDIDLFIVSNGPTTTYFNGWLDIYQLNKRDFEEAAKLLDIGVTDALFSGESIYGNKSYLEKIKTQILSSNISVEAIEYNERMSLKQKTANAITEREKNTGVNYSRTYELNAQLLSEGIKPLTMKYLKDNCGFIKKSTAI